MKLVATVHRFPARVSSTFFNGRVKTCDTLFRNNKTEQKLKEREERVKPFDSNSLDALGNFAPLTLLPYKAGE